MNILPKKRWHIRTKDNIARKNRDEKAAREVENERQQQLLLAEGEGRLSFLRKNSALTKKYSGGEQPNNEFKNVNLFSDYKSHVKDINKDNEKEKKGEKEAYEKRIGYLTYLGQDTNEALKIKSWYEKAPQRDLRQDRSKDLINKQFHDPLVTMNASISPNKTTVTNTKRKSIIYNALDRKIKMQNCEKSCISNRYNENDIKGNLKLQRLREERIKREAKERVRQTALMEPKVVHEKKKSTPTTVNFHSIYKYNCQFNPNLAKQNNN